MFRIRTLIVAALMFGPASFLMVQVRGAGAACSTAPCDVTVVPLRVSPTPFAPGQTLIFYVAVNNSNRGNCWYSTVCDSLYGSQSGAAGTWNQVGAQCPQVWVAAGASTTSGSYFYIPPREFPWMYLRFQVRIPGGCQGPSWLLFKFAKDGRYYQVTSNPGSF